jgi:hypothetical protein
MKDYGYSPSVISVFLTSGEDIDETVSIFYSLIAFGDRFLMPSRKLAVVSGGEVDILRSVKLNPGLV